MTSDYFEIEDGCLKAYRGCGRHVDVPSGVTAIGTDAFRDMMQLVQVTMPPGVRVIGEGAFHGCRCLETVVLPEGLEFIGNQAFEFCYVLENIRLPESLHTIGMSSFYSCSRLRSIRLPAALKRLWSSAFGRCPHLTDLSVDPANPFLEQDGPLLLKNERKGVYFCNRNVEGSLRLPDSVEYISDYAFEGCSALTELLLPDHLKYVGMCSLYGCTGLTSLHFPDGLEQIGSLAMDDCSSLKEVHLPQTLRYIGAMVFWKCESLRELCLPESMSWIGDYFVADCRSLEKITIPPNLKKVEKEAFRDCSELKQLVFPFSLCFIDKTALNGCSLDRLEFCGEIADLDVVNYSMSENGELIVDWYPFSRLSEKMKKKVARGVVHRIEDGIAVPEQVQEEVRSWLKENCTCVWGEVRFRQYLLSQGLIPLAKYVEIVELTLQIEEPGLTAQVLEYRRDHFADEELDEEVWKRYEAEIDEFGQAYCGDGQT